MSTRIGRIYKIVHSQSDVVYIGSTFDTLRGRWGRHKGNRVSKCCITQLMIDHGFDQFKIMLIKEYEVVDKRHLEAYEQLWINKTKCINSQSAFQPISKNEYKKQYRENHRKELSEMEKKRYYQKRDLVLIDRKQIIQCECGNTYTKGHKSRHLKSKKHLAALASQ